MEFHWELSLVFVQLKCYENKISLGPPNESLYYSQVEYVFHWIFKDKMSSSEGSCTNLMLGA